MSIDSGWWSAGRITCVALVSSVVIVGCGARARSTAVRTSPATTIPDRVGPRATLTSRREERTETQRALEITAADPQATDDVLVRVAVVQRRACRTFEIVTGEGGHVLGERPIGDQRECGHEPIVGARLELRDTSGPRLSAVTDEAGEATFSLGAVVPSEVSDDLAFALDDGQLYPASQYVRAIAALRARRLREVEESAARAIVRTPELSVAGLPLSGATTTRATERACSALGATWARTAGVSACVLDVGHHVSFEFAEHGVRSASYIEAVARPALVVRTMMQSMMALVRLYGPAAGTDGPAGPGEVHQARWELVDPSDVRWRVSLLTDSSGVVVRYERGE